ncbi:glutathione S-transferase N-terminal domain-containing protein [Candidatus Thioglobus sp.]|nr:glutathione S-transferase N-terminal domain-containing protein [Candidatus Thioglobus sp.]
MRFFLRLLREGSGRVLILIDWLFKPSVVKRNDEEQAKVDQETKILKLYQFYACPFCVKTRRAIKRLNLKVETRDAQTAGKFRKELEISGGKIKVPCLKLEGAGEATWIYESNDIIKYLDERFSQTI